MSFGDAVFERILKDALDTAIRKVEMDLGCGAARDSAFEYGRRVGVIAGLKQAGRAIESVHKQMAGEEKSIAADMARKG